jgi:hypothetical protein
MIINFFDLNSSKIINENTGIYRFNKIHLIGGVKINQREGKKELS